MFARRFASVAALLSKDSFEQERPIDATSAKATATLSKFGSVSVREYGVTICQSPFCSKGAPVTLDWEYTAYAALDMEESLWRSGCAASGHKKRHRVAGTTEAAGTRTSSGSLLKILLGGATARTDCSAAFPAARMASFGG